jgi:hypothetical protein
VIFSKSQNPQKLKEETKWRKEETKPWEVAATVKNRQRQAAHLTAEMIITSTNDGWNDGWRD